MCYCDGDIDDIDFGIKRNCKHYLTNECAEFDEDNDMEDDLIDGWI